MPTVNDFTALISGSSWAGNNFVTGQSAFVTYSFDTIIPSYLDTSFATQGFIDSFVPFTEAEKAAARIALQQWASVSGLVFMETDSHRGDIAFGSYDFSLDPEVDQFDGYAFYPQVANDLYFSERGEVGGDVFITHGSAADIFLLLHEIGHAIGLKHPFAGDLTLNPNLDNHAQTVMSYTGNTPDNLGTFDFQAVAHVYGGASSDGSHLTSWNWNATTETLTQVGRAGAEEILGTSAIDIIDGGDGADYLSGFSGDDKIYDGTGSDVVFGGSGDDYIFSSGVSGNDRYVGGDDFDFLSFASLTGGATIWLGMGTATGTLIGLDTFSEFEAVEGTSDADFMFGDDEENRLDGAGGDDTIEGAFGADTLNGGQGNDNLRGGEGADELNGGSGSDFASYRFDAAVFTSLDASVIQSGAAFGDTYISIEHLSGSDTGNDTLAGNGSANRLNGNGGDDTLQGRDGADILKGGLGNDMLSGNAGADQFIFDSTLNGLTNVDEISTVSSIDRIILDNDIFTALGAAFTVDEFRSIDSGTSFASVDATDNIIYLKSTGQLFYDRDGSGTNYARVLFADLTNNTLLNFGQFLMIE
jgi:Ca2+-binding RTX toxin-like protein